MSILKKVSILMMLISCTYLPLLDDNAKSITILPRHYSKAMIKLCKSTGIVSGTAYGQNGFMKNVINDLLNNAYKNNHTTNALIIKDFSLRHTAHGSLMAEAFYCDLNDLQRAIISNSNN